MSVTAHQPINDASVGPREETKCLQADVMQDSVQHRSFVAPFRTEIQWSYRRWTIAAVAGAALIIAGALLTNTALAQSRLPHVAPQMVPEFPGTPRIPPGPPQPRRLQPRFEELAQIERAVGFRLLLPTYLPLGCDLEEQFVYGPRVAGLRYTCIAISAQKVHRQVRPSVGLGSVHEVTVNGLPALYIDGAWVSANGGPIAWQQSAFPELWLERDGVFVRLRIWPQMRLADPKQELIRIAESLRYWR